MYIDDILILQREDETEDDHLNKIETVLSRLENKDFRANLRKSFFMQKELEYLGYLLTDKGLKPGRIRNYRNKSKETQRRIPFTQPKLWKELN